MCSLPVVQLIVKESPHQLSLAACVSIGQICRCGPLSLPDASSQTDVLSKKLLVQTLSDKLSTSVDIKVMLATTMMWSPFLFLMYS